MLNLLPAPDSPPPCRISSPVNFNAVPLHAVQTQTAFESILHGFLLLSVFATSSAAQHHGTHGTAAAAPAAFSALRKISASWRLNFASSAGSGLITAVFSALRKARPTNST